MSTPVPTPRRSRWLALLEQRCPRCREGRMFRGFMTMNDPCPVCGMVFEREPGYFLGAMYFSYALGVVFLVPLYYLVRWIWPEMHFLLQPLVAFIPFLFLVPALFRYSRVLWIYFDRAIAPSEIS